MIEPFLGEILLKPKNRIFTVFLMSVGRVKKYSETSLKMLEII